MKPPSFDYVAAESLEEALDVLAKEGMDACVLAGGQSLIAMLNMRLVKPGVVVDIARTRGLDRIETEGDAIVVSAAVTQRSLLEHPGLAEEVPLLALALPWVGHFQTRSKGTVCGSIAHADPSSELPLCLAALGGEVRLRSRRGRRTLTAAEFQTGMLSTARAPDELIEAVKFPKPAAGSGHAFREFGYRRGDFAVVAVAAVARADGIRIGVGGMTDRPEVRELPVLAGTALDDALNDLAWELRGTDDQHATARYRRDLLRTLGRQAIEEAIACRA
jgi:2-furoyl-CoA dehydrogenase FAD binding subunit